MTPLISLNRPHPLHLLCACACARAACACGARTRARGARRVVRAAARAVGAAAPPGVAAPLPARRDARGVRSNGSGPAVDPAVWHGPAARPRRNGAPAEGQPAARARRGAARGGGGPAAEHGAHQLPVQRRPLHTQLRRPRRPRFLRATPPTHTATRRTARDPPPPTLRPPPTPHTRRPARSTPSARLVGRRPVGRGRALPRSLAPPTLPIAPCPPSPSRQQGFERAGTAGSFRERRPGRGASPAGGLAGGKCGAARRGWMSSRGSGEEHAAAAVSRCGMRRRCIGID